MPGNALAGILDDPDPLPNTLSSSHLQAISYSGEQVRMLILLTQCMPLWHTSRDHVSTCMQSLAVESVQHVKSMHQAYMVWQMAGHETLAAPAHIDRGLLIVGWDDAPGLQGRLHIFPCIHAQLIGISSRNVLAIMDGSRHYSACALPKTSCILAAAVSCPFGALYTEPAIAGAITVVKCLSSCHTEGKTDWCVCGRHAAACNSRPHPRCSSQGSARNHVCCTRCGATLLPSGSGKGRMLLPLMHACDHISAGRKMTMRWLLPVCCRFPAAPECRWLSSSGRQNTLSLTCAMCLAFGQTAGVLHYPLRRTPCKFGIAHGLSTKHNFAVDHSHNGSAPP